MYGLFQPEQRRLTEEQFILRVNGADLSHIEMQALRRDCGLPHDEQAILNELMQDRIAVLAWQKVGGRCTSLLAR